VSSILLLSLHELHSRLTRDDSNLPEQFSFFTERSSTGVDCGFAEKARALFMRRDYNDIRELVLSVVQCYSDIEGEDIIVRSRSKKGG
jgi:hypothetical protein